MVTVTRSTELEEFARDARLRFETGDVAWFEQTTAYGEVGGFGTAEEERATGRDEILALTKAQIAEMHKTSGLDIAAPVSGRGRGFEFIRRDELIKEAMIEYQP